MPSTFFGLNIGYTGLQAANAALNVTGNNISNVNTEGYSRQKATQEAAKALRTNNSYGMAGAGVDTISIDQIRNSFYDLKYWNNNASLGIYDIKQQYNKQIEDMFTDTDSVQGFNVIFSDIFNSLDEVYKSGGDSSVKNEFISNCETLSQYFQSMYRRLQKLQEDANNEIQTKADEINALASEIASLNKQINMIEVNGTVANELRDKRSLVVDQLSTIVDVQIDEVPIKRTESDDAEEAGIYKYIVNIGGGQMLVNGYEYYTLECKARDYKANQSDVDGLYDLTINGITLNLYGGSLGGELKGLLEMRDGNNGEYFNQRGTTTKVLSDGTKQTTKHVNVTDARHVSISIADNNVNYAALTDMNKSTLSPTGKITIGGKEFYYDSWQYDSNTKTYDFVLSDFDKSVNPPMPQNALPYDGKDAFIGTELEYQGIPYYMSQMNEWIRSFSQAMNKIELTAQDVNGNPAEVMFTQGEDDKQFDDYYASPTVTSSMGNNYYQLTAATFRMNSKMINDVNFFGTTSDINQGRDAQDIAEQLLTVKDDKSKVVFRGRSAGEFLQCVTSDVALNASSANSFYNNYSKISDSIINQRLSEMGVDNDEEALNLVKYQEAYNLAAKMIQVMTEIYDQLILRTGV